MHAFTRVIPLLIYRDIQAAHDFLVEVFGFESGGVERTADDQTVHGEVRAGGTVIWLHRVNVEHQLNSPQTLDMTSSGLVVHVQDVDAHFAHTRAAGARIDYEPMDQPYGQREYGARDPEGHPWWFATPFSDLPAA
jgi:MerR family transcriptional regulator, thiopeptide resistance regulator